VASLGWCSTKWDVTTIVSPHGIMGRVTLGIGSRCAVLHELRNTTTDRTEVLHGLRCCLWRYEQPSGTDVRANAPRGDRGARWRRAGGSGPLHATISPAAMVSRFSIPARNSLIDCLGIGPCRRNVRNHWFLVLRPLHEARSRRIAVLCNERPSTHGQRLCVHVALDSSMAWLRF